MTEEKQTSVYPPREVFEDGGVGIMGHTEPILDGQLTTPAYHAHFPEEGGVLVYHVGEKYPHKAWPFKEAIYAVDTIKRAVINSLKFASSFPVRYGIGLVAIILFPWKKRIIREALVQFTDYTDIVFTRWGVLWKPQYYCDMVREIHLVGMNIAGDDVVNQRMVRSVCMFFEFDDAYRYIAQDAAELIDIEAMLKNPAKEISRVLAIVIERGKGTAPKFKVFLKFLPFLLRIKQVRDPITKFFSEVKIKNLYLHKFDWYRCLLWGNYNFRGIPAEERVSLRIMVDAQWQLEQKVEELKRK